MLRAASSQRSRCRPQRARQRLLLEPLEERTVPTILWSNAAALTVVDAGGPVITHVDVDLIFWGAGWKNAQATMTKVVNSVQTIMDSPYLSGLSQYRDVGNGTLLRTDLITSTSPAAATTNSQYDALVRTNLNNGVLTVTPKMDSQILYMVIPQPGTQDPMEGAGGAHGSDVSNFGRFHYGWTINTNSLDAITYFYSHELTESVTDPEPGFHFGFWVPKNGNEICDGVGPDGEAQLYSYRLNGVLVQSSLSQKDHAYAVYDGNSQNLVLTKARALTVSGDQLASQDDAITIDQSNNGYQIALNGETFQFDPRDFFNGATTVSAITVNSGDGNDTLNIEKTISGRSLIVNLGGGNDTVNLSPNAKNLANLAGSVTVNGGSGSDTLEFFDQGVNHNQNYAIASGTITRSGMAMVTYKGLANLTLDTSAGTDTITVQGTPSGTAVAVNGGSGVNTLVDSAAQNVWSITATNGGTLSSANIAGSVTFSSVQNLTGGTAGNTFLFSDGAGISGTIHGGSSDGIDYSAYTTDVAVNLQTGTATGIGGTFTGIQNLTGGGGHNTLVGADVSNSWNITGTNTGTVTGASLIAFAGFQNLSGGAAANSFVFSDGAGITGSLDGGAAGSLDYSAYSTSVIVDLQTGFATGVGGGIAHIQNVTGGNGGGVGVFNILVGNGGNVLTGGNGRRNLLIAGSSASTLTGGDDDDILIGGTTAYDMDLASLIAIMNYWSGSSDDYATRVGNLLGGNGVPMLNATTVTSNGGGNTLNGGPGMNLYYGNAGDTTDFDPNSGAVFVPV